MIYEAGPKTFGRLALAPDHFDPAYAGKKRKPVVIPESSVAANAGRKVDTQPLPSTVASPSKSGPAEAALQQEAVSASARPAAPNATFDPPLSTDAGEAVEPRSRRLPRVDAARAREIAGAMAVHGKRAFRQAKAGAGKAAVWTTRAARWTRTQTRRAASLASRLMTATTNTRVDPLEELAVASRYAAVSNRLASLASLTEREEAAVRQGTPDRRIHQAGSEIVLEGETTTPMFIASGWACRTRTSRDGRRQIVGLLLPGDGISLGAAHGAVLNTSVTALTAVETVSAAGIVEMANDAATFPGVNEALHSLRVLEDEFLVNQITRLGVATVVERVTHLLLELHWRLGHAGLATETLVPLPVNEETLGDALGLRPQAIKRVLYQLRAHGLIRLGYGRIAIKREDRLRTISGFRPPATSPRAAERRLICDVNAPVPEQAFQANTRTNAEVAMRPEDSSRVVAFQARQLACQLTPP